MSQHLKQVSEDSFFQAITGKQLLVVCFSSATKKVCTAFEEVLEIAATNHPDVHFATVDTDNEHSLAKEFNIQSVPSVMVFREAVILFSQHGTLSLAEIEDLIDKAKQFDMAEVREEKQKQYE